MGLKPSTIEQAKFEYPPLGNIFTKGLKEEDKKDGLFKRLENIKGKYEELLNAFSGANKVSKAAKNESNYNYDSKYTFTYKKNYNSGRVKDEEKRGCDYKRFDKEKQESEWTEEKTKTEMQKPLWFKINRNEFG